jgi:hypothetical protein
VADGQIVYRAAGASNRPGAREDILYGALDNTRREFSARDEVARRAAIVLPGASAAETAAVAATVRVDRGDIGTSITFRDVDGVERGLTLQDNGAISLPGITPEPE